MASTNSTIPARITKDRKHLLNVMLSDMDSMSPDEFVKYLKDNCEKYETMPMVTKKKAPKEAKPPKLTAVTGWSVFSKEYISEKKEDAFSENEKLPMKEQQNKFEIIGTLRTNAAEQWKSGSVNTDDYNDKAQTVNTDNLESWRKVYSDMDKMSVSDIAVKLKSEENIKKNMKKRDLLHMMGCAGYSDKVTQCTKIKTLRSELVTYYKDNCV